jgi:serine/threonine protein kinase
MVVKADPGWIGLQVEDYLIQRILGGGAYSVVYEGTHADRKDGKAFKVARPPSFICQPNPADLVPTRALVFYSNGFAVVQPDPIALLSLQGKKLSSVDDPSLVAVERIFEEQGMCYLRMELLHGHTLSAALDKRPLPLSIFVELARALERLSRVPSWGYHGDLKPDNVMVTSTGIKILDPGHFGRLQGTTGQMDCVVTTPAYYPLLKPDDLWALGIMLWQAAVRRHPFFKSPDEPLEFHISEELENRDDIEPEDTLPAEATEVGDKLFALVRSAQQVGQYFLDPLLYLKQPRALLPEMPAALEEVLLRAMRLTVLGSGKLELAEGYASFAELARALENLINMGIDQV